MNLIIGILNQEETLYKKQDQHKLAMDFCNKLLRFQG
jgi:hypothetical protein